MVMGKHKGNAFELKIYKNLRELGFCKRTIGSGSSDESGDITFEIGHKMLSIECKHLKKVRWSILNKFWDKLNKEIKSFGKGEPVIIFRQNNEPIMVMCIGEIEGKKVRCITSFNLWRQIIK